VGLVPLFIDLLVLSLIWLVLWLPVARVFGVGCGSFVLVFGMVFLL